MSKVFGFIWTAFFTILFAPFIIPAFLIVKLMGGNPFNLDGMGVDFMIMCLIAVGIAVASGAFLLGTII